MGVGVQKSMCMEFLLTTKNPALFTYSQSGDDVASILHQLVEVGELLASLKLLQEVLLEMLQLVTDVHV